MSAVYNTPKQRREIIKQFRKVPGHVIVNSGIDMLRNAIVCFEASNHPHTVERLKLALSSAYGARRIESYRDSERVRRDPPKNVRRAVLRRIV